MRIDRVEARAISDSRGKYTVETSVWANTLVATASVPSGKSTGVHEAFELRDADGGVRKAIDNVNGEIRDALVGRRFYSLDELDEFLIELDGTQNKARLGANALLSVSIAATRLSALLENFPVWNVISKRAKSTPKMPFLYVNVMNGGVHADFKLPFQEYILVVDGSPSTSIPIAREAFAKIGERLGNVPMGDEGGYAPAFDRLEEPFEILARVVNEFSNLSIAIDAAASEFHTDGRYNILGKGYNASELTKIYEKLIKNYPIHSIEDPFEEDAHEDFASLTKSLGSKVLIVGDDLTVTNPALIKKAAEHGEINAVLIKPNQIGTVCEALSAVLETNNAGWQAIASHRSGETFDAFISDFAYGVGAHGIKAGGLGQQERLEKYERLLAIEREAKTV